MKNIFKQFIKYTVVGGSGMLLDLGSLALFTEIFLITPWIAVAINQTFVIGYNFTLNKLWSFRNRDVPHPQLARYLLLVCVNYLFGVGMMYLFNEQYEIDPYFVRIVTIALSVIWNFLLYKYWVFPTFVTQEVIHKKPS